MNTQVHDATSTSPYEAVFGQKPRAVIFPSRQSVRVFEEDLEKEGVSFSEDCSFRKENNYGKMRQKDNQEAEKEGEETMIHMTREADAVAFKTKEEDYKGRDMQDERGWFQRRGCD